MLTLGLGLGAGILAAGTAISEKRGVRWWLRYFDFPRMQIMGLAALMLPAAAARTRGKARAAIAGALAGVVCWQAYKVRRFTPLAPWQSLPARRQDPDRRVRILVANVWEPNRRAATLLGIIRAEDPDIIVLAETDHWWEEAVRELEKTHPNTLKRPLENTYGMLVYSRLPWSDAQLRALLMDGIPSAVANVQLPSGDRFRLYTIHPLPPGVGQDTTHRDAELVLIGKEARSRGEPAIVAGDLNDVAWSYTTRLFQKISRMLDPRIGRGFYNTFNAKRPPLRFPLDHVFHTDHFRVVSLRRLAGFGSDHFPILTELSYEPKGADDQEAPKLGREGRQAAKRKLRKARDSGLMD